MAVDIDFALFFIASLILGVTRRTLHMVLAKIFYDCHIHYIAGAVYRSSIQILFVCDLGVGLNPKQRLETRYRCIEV